MQADLVVVAGSQREKTLVGFEDRQAAGMPLAPTVEGRAPQYAVDDVHVHMFPQGFSEQAVECLTHRPER